MAMESNDDNIRQVLVGTAIGALQASPRISCVEVCERLFLRPLVFAKWMGERWHLLEFYEHFSF